MKTGEACALIGIALRNCFFQRSGMCLIFEYVPHDKERARSPKSCTSEIRIYLVSYMVDF